MSFADTMKRTDDNPNAFKLARRMIESWSPESLSYEKPELGKYDATFSVQHDGSPTSILALAFVEAALHKVNGGSMKDCYLYRGKDNSASIRLVRKQFPVQETLRQLDVLQKQFQSNWVKDDSGNYRHVKSFEHMGRQGADCDLNHLDRCRLSPSCLRVLLLRLLDALKMSEIKWNCFAVSMATRKSPSKNYP